MQTFNDVIEAFGGARFFGEAIGIPDSHARTMKSRGSIPLEHWTAVVAAAAQRSLPGITFEALAGMAARRRLRQEADPQPEAVA